MKNILIIGGGLAALYFATQGKKGNATNSTGNGNTGGNLAPVVGSGNMVTAPAQTPSGQNNQTFDVEIVEVSGDSGYKAPNFANLKDFLLIAKYKVTNRSNKPLKLKYLYMKTPLLSPPFDLIADEKLKPIFQPGESRVITETKSIRAFAGSVFQRDQKVLTIEEILETAEFKVTL